MFCKGISSVSLPHSLDRMNNSSVIFIRRLEIYHLKYSRVKNANKQASMKFSVHDLDA